MICQFCKQPIVRCESNHPVDLPFLMTTCTGYVHDDMYKYHTCNLSSPSANMTFATPEVK